MRRALVGVWIALIGLAACTIMREPIHPHGAPPPPSGPPPLVAVPAGMEAFAYAPLTPQALIEHVERLASDEFEGRAPGTRGETLTVDYLIRAFSAAGLQPGVPNGDVASWVQSVPIVTTRVTNAPTLTLTDAQGPHALAYGPDFVAMSQRLAPQTTLEDAPLVFVGYGIVAPQLGWNDYAGLDMTGKVAVILINDPDFNTGDNRGFRGRAMTYYGRWTYKFEEASRQGAAGALIIHETAAAAYPWAVVNSSWTGPRYQLPSADAGASRVAVEGWITDTVAQGLFTRAGLDLAAERRRAQQRGFTPTPLTATASIAIETTVETGVSRNVIGVLPGRERPEEAVLYSAHWDHLGRCAPVDGDDICNGARDNATGVAGLIELARHFGGAPRAQRSVAFIAFTAEEANLLGSAYYAENPVFAPARTAAMINMDGLSNSGPAREITVIGWGQNDLETMLTQSADAQGRRVQPEPTPEEGRFYRSDHLNLARVGVPVLYTLAGVDLYEGGVTRGRALAAAYTAEHYHQPSDEVTPDWNMVGAMRDLQLLQDVGYRVADSTGWPAWRPNSEFRAAREASRR